MKEENPIVPLFDLDPAWKEEWGGMPEFVQQKQAPYCQIIFRFDTEPDLAEFSKLIGQPLTRHTKSAWYPAKSHWRTGNPKRWVSES